jgi:thioredoxin-related protein
MKKWSVATLALAAGLYATAQDTGMHFEHTNSWEQVLAKAKAENKYIFVDCYTTWCGPCKQMSKNIFPQAEVGKFYNDHYINVKVQLDSTDADNEEVRSWYADGKKLATQYEVHAYPTYLFFDPNGQIVHRAVGSSPAEKFIAKGEDALEPQKQYYTLKKQYAKGGNNEAFLYKMATTAQDAYDMDFAKRVTDEYLATQKDWYTKENLDLMMSFADSKDAAGFKAAVENPDKVDAALGKGTASKVVKSVVLGEDIYPKIFIRSGGVVANPNWLALKADLKKQYPKQADELLAYSKVMYARRKKDWPMFGNAVSEYMKSYGSTATPGQMNDFAWTVFENCNDAACVASALEWSKQSFADNQSHQYMDTYANLLYKAGKKQEAITWETKAMTLAKEAKEDTGDYEANLDKMKKGEKTW